MSNPTATEPLLTAEDLYEIAGDGHRYELVEGRLVVSEPTGMWHGALALRIGALLERHVTEHRLGLVVVETGYVLRRGPDTVRGPDVSFVRAGRLPSRATMHRFYEGTPDLAVEIVSPGDRAGDVARKVAGYLTAGTALLWVVHPELRRVVVHRADGTARMVGDDATLDGEDVVPGFAVPVAELFPVLPDDAHDMPDE